MTLFASLNEKLKIQSRNIDIATHQFDEAHILVYGVLHDRRRVSTYNWDGMAQQPDTVHDLRIALKIAVDSLTITAVEVEFRKVPHEECLALQNILAQIKGMRLARGFSAEVRKRIGGRKGCMHLMTLLLAMAPAALQGYWTHNSIAYTPGRYSREQMQAYLVDSCRVWRRKGPLEKKIAQASGIELDPD